MAYDFGTSVSGPNRYYSRVTPEVLALPSASATGTSSTTANSSEQNSTSPHSVQNTYLNTDHYTEVSSVKNTSASSETSWPSDINVDSMSLHSPPPVPQWPNDCLVLVDCSSDKATFQESVKSSVVTSESSSQQVEHQIITNEEEIKSPVKMLDPKFIAELEKCLGQKEACANTNPPNSNVRFSPTDACSDFPLGMSAKGGTTVLGNISSVGRSKQNESAGTSVIPPLKPPPHSSKVSQKNSSLTSSK